MKSFLYVLLCTSVFAVAADDPSAQLFDDSEPARINVAIPEASLQWLYQHVNSDSEFYASFQFHNRWITKSIDSVGFSLRGNTSREAAKKSFQISFNTFKKKGDFRGLEKINLRADHNDPSLMRSKLCFDLFQKIGVTASRSHFVRMYINDRYYGLYVHVEHIDNTFVERSFSDKSGNLWKCLYPADLVYMGEAPDRYRYLKHDQATPAYDLKTNEKAADYSKLIRLTRLLNSTPDTALPDSLEAVIDVVNVLKYFAMNVLVGGWDDYRSLMNNYYLYHEPASDRLHIIPYDYDNTFGVDWFNIDWSSADPYRFPQVAKGSRPLADRMLGIPKYRDLFSHFLQYYIAHVFSLPLLQNRIDSLHNSIAVAVENDLYRTLDYGFTFADFNNSFSASGYRNQHVKRGLAEFILLRTISLQSQLTWQTSKPIIYQHAWTPSPAGATDSLHLAVSVFSRTAIKRVEVRYATPSNLIVPLAPSDAGNTTLVEAADQYRGLLPPLPRQQALSFSIWAIDQQDQATRYPRSGNLTARPAVSGENRVLLNEIMADNQTTLASPGNAFADWLELYNAGTGPVLLTGKYLSDKPEQKTLWRFTQPGLYIQPGEHLLVWCDNEPTRPGLHTNFKLDKDGECMVLVDSDGVQLLDAVSFGPQQSDIAYGRQPDGGEAWTFLKPTPGHSNDNSTMVESIQPTTLQVASAWPNPFNQSLSIGYQLQVPAEVRVLIFDALGRVVWQECRGYEEPGRHTIYWRGTDPEERAVASGIYFIRLVAGQEMRQLKVLCLK
jgi:hypothetical protein